MDVVDWLLDGDPAIRWQVLRDLVGAPAEQVAAERARVETEGWGARLLALRDPDGQWDGGACFPRWVVDDWHAGEFDPYINGRTLSVGASFGADVDALVSGLLADQLDDGGWNCEAEKGASVSSFDSTICVLEGLLEYEGSPGRVPVEAARRRGEEYLLERGLFRRRSTGEVVVPRFLQLSWPPRWQYDVPRGLDHLRRTGGEPDERVGDAVRHLRDKRRPDGTWLLENTHPGQTHLELEDGDGRPSRWNTLRALRVLDWYDRHQRGA